MIKIKKLTLIMLILLAFSCPVMGEEITIVGTGSGIAILEALGEAFSLINPGVKINAPESIGSGGGIKAVGRDEYLIGRIAREIKPGEMNYGLSYVPFAKMPIVFFINKNVGIKNLSTRQICDIYSGKITNWEEVGGKNVRIKVVRREESDSSLSYLLKEFPGFADIAITSRSKTTFTDQETLDFIEKTPDTIAFGTYGNAVNSKVDILNINDKSPAASEYAYFGTLALIFKENNRKGNIGKFIDFVTSEAAHEAIQNAGGMPF